MIAGALGLSRDRTGGVGGVGGGSGGYVRPEIKVDVSDPPFDESARGRKETGIKKLGRWNSKAVGWESHVQNLKSKDRS